MSSEVVQHGNLASLDYLDVPLYTYEPHWRAEIHFVHARGDGDDFNFLFAVSSNEGSSFKMTNGNYGTVRSLYTAPDTDGPADGAVIGDATDPSGVAGADDIGGASSRHVTGVFEVYKPSSTTVMNTIRSRLSYINENGKGGMGDCVSYLNDAAKGKIDVIRFWLTTGGEQPNYAGFLSGQYYVLIYPNPA